MAAKAYTVRPVSGLRQSPHRSVAFLLSDEDEDINAAETFDRLIPAKRRAVLDRFDYWISGGHNDDYFHGWPNEPSYKDCFVFKWKDGRQRHRLYGFLCHPLLQTNRRFQLCVLVS